MKGTKRSKKTAKEEDPCVVKVPSGIKGPDDIPGGGLPKGRPALVSGGPGNGKTLSAMEFIAGGITDRHESGGFVSFEEKTEDLLREQRKQLQSILDNSRDIIFRVDRDFRFSVINEAGLRLIGLPAEQVLGKTNAELGALTELSELWETHYRNVFETSLADRFEQALPGPDGTRYYIATLVPEFDDEGEVGSVLGIAVDVTELKRAEEALKKSEERLELALRGAREGVWDLLPATGAVWYSSRWKEMLGYSEGEIEHHVSAWERLLHPDDREQALRYFGNVLKGEREDFEMEFRLRHKKGHYVPILSRGVIVRNQPGGTVTRVVGTHFDLTHQKAVEKALHEGEERLRLAQKAAGIGIWDWNIPAGELSWDPQLFAIFGLDIKYDRPDFSTWDRILHPEDLAIAHERIDAALRNHTDLDSHYRIIRPDGEVRWIQALGQGIYDQQGEPVRMTGTCIDITGRKLAEEELRKSEERFRTISDFTMDWEFWSSPEGRFLYQSPSADDVLGRLVAQYTSAELLYREITHPDDLEARFAHLQREMAGDGPLESEFRLVRPDGEVRWIHHVCRPIHNKEGRFMGTRGSNRDITTQKQTEIALRESEERFRSFYENAQVGFAFLDPDFRYRYINKILAGMNGHSVNDHINRTVEEMIPEIWPSAKAAFEEVRETKQPISAIEFEGESAAEPGMTKYWLESIYPVIMQDGKLLGLGIVIIDITDRKRAEVAIRESGERLNQAFDLLEAVTLGTEVIIAAQDTDFHYTYFNKAYADEIKRLTGRELSLGMSMIELFDHMPDEQRNAIRQWSRIFSGKSVNETIIFGDPGHHRRTYHVLHTPIFSTDGRVIGAGEVAYDITEQARIEYELGETKKHLENLINYANAPIVVWDPEFRITRFNHAFEYLTGRSAQEVVGQDLAVLFPGDSLDEAMDLIKKTMTGERWESVEIPIQHKDGGVKTVLWNSASIYGSDAKTLVSVIAQGQDITDRKKIEHELTQRAVELETVNILMNEEIARRKSTDAVLNDTLSLLNAALESTADGIIVIDLEGAITSANRNFSEMWNLQENLIETRDSGLVTDCIVEQVKDARSFRVYLDDLMQHPERESYDMLELRDGRIFERYTKPQKIGNVVVGRLWSYRDITDRRTAEENLVASLREKEILLREIHHRVKNNLQIISGLLDMTRMRTADVSTRNILTDMMLKIQTMAQIHTRLYESKQFGRICIDDQIRDQIASLQAIYSGNRHKVSIEIHSPGIFLPVDQAIPFALIVNEILSNALKHAFKGRGHGSVNITASDTGGQILISIKDDGVGLPEEFDISRTNSLGMKLIRTLTEHQLKGTLNIIRESGTEMIVQFPAVRGGR